jgi:hypothetical protein
VIKHIAVWIDHSEARVFHLHPDQADHQHREFGTLVTVDAPTHHVHRHPKGRSGEARPHPEDLPHFFTEVGASLRHGRAVLLLGPGSAKDELFKYLLAHDAEVAARVVGVEALDHPSNEQIVAYARAAFVKSDRMAG